MSVYHQLPKYWLLILTGKWRKKAYTKARDDCFNLAKISKAMKF
jgi:hypothetical protein